MPLRRTITSTPSAWYSAPAPAPTLGQTVKEGFGLGLGSAVAHRVVGAVLGPPKIEMAVPSGTKQSHDLWARCLEQTNYDVEKCTPFKPADKPKE